MGNLTRDNLGNTFAYDAEGRPTTINGNAVTYDAFGRAVEIQTGSSSYQQVLYSPSGQKFAFMNATAVQQYILPLEAGMQAVFSSSGLWYYRYADWLGSSRLAADENGNFTVSRGFAPFGETYNGVANGPDNRLFTGQTQDVIANPQGIYDFLFRQLSSTQGRWLVPDPAGLAAVDLTNPQTWNRYAYVGNNPLSNVDPLGLKVVPCAAGKDPGTICVDDPQPGNYSPGGWWDLAFEGWPGSGSLQSFFCMLMGGCTSSTQTQTSGGGGGAVVSAQPQPKPQPQATNGATIGPAGKFHCAAAIADRLSLANQAHMPGPSNPTLLDQGVGYVGNAVFGNTISGIVQFVDTAKTATNAAPVYWGLMTNGLRLGVPGGGVMGQGLVGVAQDKVLQGAFVNLGVTASKTAANFVGGLKFGYDAVTFGYGLYECTNF